MGLFVVVDAFFLAAREGNFDALVGVLDPDVVTRIDAGAHHPAASMILQSAESVARQTLKGLSSSLAYPGIQVRPAQVNNAAGVVAMANECPLVVMGFTIAKGKIVEINSIADPEHVRRIATVFSAQQP